jgi:hypothetical protein
MAFPLCGHEYGSGENRTSGRLREGGKKEKQTLNQIKHMSSSSVSNERNKK